MRPFGRGAPRTLLKDYAEGRRLMRHGDGADEWLGMRFAKDAQDALEVQGFNTDGSRIKECPKCQTKGRSHLVVAPRTGESSELRIPSYYSCTQRLLALAPEELERKHIERHWNDTCPYTRPEGCRIWRDLARAKVEELIDA